MTHTLKISDGTTTVNLTTASVSFLLDYEPQTPSITLQEAISAIRDGGEVTSATQRNVTESARVVLTGANGAAVQTTARSIERLFRQAEERQRRQFGGPAAVYVQVQLTSDSGEWRSEILSGSLTLTDTVWDEWSNNKAEVILTWTRRYYWEGAEATVQVAVDSDPTMLNSLTITNLARNSANVAQIYASQVGGSLPAPCRITLQNDTGGALDVYNIYIGQSIWIDGENWTANLEGEDNETGGGSDTLDSPNSSGNYYHAVTWASNSTHSSIRYVYTLSTAALAYASGGYFRMLARFGVDPNVNTYVKTQVRHQDVYILQETPEVQLKAQALQDLGVIQLPPALGGLSGLGDVKLYMSARASVAGSMSIDYIQLTPLDGWRHLKTLGGTFPDGTLFVDDGIAGYAYVDESGTDKYANLVARGNQIMLWPNQDQRLYVLVDNDNGDCNIGWELIISIAYRPRRLTI